MTDRNDIARAMDRLEEAVVVDTQIYLQRVMDARGISRAQLADLMGVSRARITQIFSAECKNFTIRLLARAAAAMGEEVEVSSQLIRQLDSNKSSRKTQEIVAASENIHHIWTDEGVWFSADDDCGSSANDLHDLIKADHHSHQSAARKQRRIKMAA